MSARKILAAVCAALALTLGSAGVALAYGPVSGESPSPNQDPCAAGPGVLRGTNGNDTLDARQLTGPVTICGFGGGDTIYANDAGDTIYAGPGSDKIIGGAGNDYIEGQGGDDYIDGGLGNDTISAKPETTPSSPTTASRTTSTAEPVPTTAPQTPSTSSKTASHPESLRTGWVNNVCVPHVAEDGTNRRHPLGQSVRWALVVSPVNSAPALAGDLVWGSLSSPLNTTGRFVIANRLVPADVAGS
jgi:Ca2+-binding RTX toxin-like protein